MRIRAIVKTKGGHGAPPCPSSIQWILDPRTPRGAKSCTTVCADVSKTCDQPSLDNLNNNDAAFAAAFDAWNPGHCNN
jgi:hypothetical protein